MRSVILSNMAVPWTAPKARFLSRKNFPFQQMPRCRASPGSMRTFQKAREISTFSKRASLPKATRVGINASSRGNLRVNGEPS